MSYERLLHTGGRPRILRQCETCGKEFSAREMVEHRAEHSERDTIGKVERMMRLSERLSA